MKRSNVIGAMWTAAAAAALLAPLPAGTWLDGVPLDTGLDVVLIGMVAPFLFVFGRRVLDRHAARAFVIAVAVAKIAAAALLTTNGFCTQFVSDAPLQGPIENIAVEPNRLMRSWDVRAQWGGSAAECSAITRRDYATRSRFPAWFMNLLENSDPPQHAVTMTMRGVVTPRDDGGHLSIILEPSTDAAVVADGRRATRSNGSFDVGLGPGPHHIEVRARLSGTEWRMVPRWNGQSLWSSVLVTVASPSTVDRLLWRVLPTINGVLVVVFVAYWLFAAARSAPLDALSLAIVAIVSIATVTTALSTPFARFAAALIGLVALAPAARRGSDWRSAGWLLGVPWLAFAGALAAPRFGEFSMYSRADDWLTYQASAYRIYLEGYWVEAGQPLWWNQPLYRWIAGALHLVFGDSSIGEPYWDGACLFVGAMLAFMMTRPWIAAQRAVVAAALTLVTFTVTPIWYFIGRGLAEISAGGFAWLAALLLMRARVTGIWAAVGAGLCGVLAYYARLNHIPFAFALVVFLLPLDMPCGALRDPLRVLRAVRVSLAVTYVAVLVLGFALLMVRAWFYTGEWSPFAGTSFATNATGLSPETLFSGEVWRRVVHNVFAEMIVHESFDARGLLVLAGSGAALLGLLQVPGFAHLPLVAALAVAGSIAGAFVAHSHGYPARFSVHLIPFATAVAAIAVVKVAQGSMRLSGLRS